MKKKIRRIPAVSIPKSDFLEYSSDEDAPSGEDRNAGEARMYPQQLFADGNINEESVSVASNGSLLSSGSPTSSVFESAAGHLFVLKENAELKEHVSWLAREVEILIVLRMHDSSKLKRKKVQPRTRTKKNVRRNPPQTILDITVSMRRTSNYQENCHF
jgi:hypothetical protein